MPILPKRKVRSDEGRIFTDLSLSDVLEYSGITEVEHDGALLPAVEFEQPRYSAESMLTMTISDVNKGLFDGYNFGHLLFEGHTPLKRIQKADKQVEWFEKVVKIHRTMIRRSQRRSDPEARLYPGFSIYEGLNSRRYSAFFHFQENEDLPVVLCIDLEIDRFRKRREVRKIVSPFVAKDRLEDVIDELRDCVA